MNYYELLGISKDASKDQIKQAYRKLAMQFHPDKHVHSPKNIQDTATSKFKKANEAYETLINDRMRANYDYGHGSSYSSHKSDYYRRYNYNYGGNGFGFEFTHGMGIRGFRLRTGYGLMCDVVGTLACIWAMETIGEKLQEKLDKKLKAFEEKLDKKLKEFEEKVDKKVKELKERIEDEKNKSKEII